MIPLLLLLACGAGDPPSIANDTDADTISADDGGPLKRVFSFAILADPHIGGVEHQQRLSAAVDWINTKADARDIELVFVLGDIAWGDGLDIAPGQLDALTMPYLPIIGDNVIQAGDEQAFDASWSPHYDAVSAELDDWERADRPSREPELGGQAWFQNFRFSYRGITFLGLDWASREITPVYGEMAERHDHTGGTWRWFSSQLDTLNPDKAESVVLLSHHPMEMSPGAFDVAEWEQIAALTAPHADDIAAAYAGHYHIDIEEPQPDAGYTMFATDATWDDANRVRLVEVWANNVSFSYEQVLIDVPGW